MTPFVKELLNYYNLAINQVSPNSWGGILAFQCLYEIIEVRPTLTLWRHIYKLVEMMAGENGSG